jgi:hypothetical protein
MPSILKSDVLAAMVRELRDHGIDQYKVRLGRKHPCLTFEIAGRQRKVFFARSPSD